MTDQVTRLIVRADGALATLNQFEKGMEGAGKATDYSSGAIASFQKRMAAANQAIERGNAVATQTVARKSQDERAWERLSSTVDRTIGLRIRQERESARASADAANVVNMGRVSEEEALNTLMKLERRHAAEMAAHIAAENNVAGAYNRTAAAAENAVAATGRLNAANSNRRMGASNFNTANVAAQFQDIAVTSAMGMNPIQIALQQGTQLSAVLGGQGLTGVVKTLGAAFASVLSPVSLITIGVVALASWGIQAFMNMNKGTEDATTALEKHNEWLDKTLVGYDKLREAAEAATDAALKLPEGVVSSDLIASLKEQKDTTADIGRQIDANREALKQFMDDASSPAGAMMVGVDAGPGLDSIVAQAGALRDLGLAADSSAADLDAAMVAARTLFNETDNPAIKDMADQAYGLAVNLKNVQAMALSAGTALRALPRNIQIRLQMSQEFNKSVAGIQDLYMDPRSSFDIARENLKNKADEATATAQTYGELTGAASEYERVLTSINAAEAKSKEKAGASAAKSAQKPFDQWSGNVEQFQQRIASQKLEIDLAGKSTFEIERQKAAFDLLNQAKQAGIPITAQVTDQINSMSSEYAAATIELDWMSQAANDNTAMWTSAQNGVSSVLKTWAHGGDVLAAIGDQLSSIADMLIDMTVRNLFKNAFSGGASGSGGGNIFGFLGSLFGGGMGSGLAGTSSITGSSGGFFPAFATGGDFTVGGAGGTDSQLRAMRLTPGETVSIRRPDQTPAANSNRQSVVFGDINIQMPPSSGNDNADTAQAQQIARLVKSAVDERLSANMRSGGLLNRRL